MRAYFLGCLVLGAAVATLALTACGARQAPTARTYPQDGLWRDLQACEEQADASARPSETYDACLDGRGL